MLRFQRKDKSAIHRSCRVVAILLWLILFPSLCLAIPIAEYQKQLQSVIDTLSSLDLNDDEEDDLAYSKRVDEAAEAIKKSLPQRVTVQLDQQAIEADNTWIHTSLDHITRAKGNERKQLLARTISRVKGVVSRVDEVQHPEGNPGLEKSDAQKRLEGILARPEFKGGPQGDNALTRLLKRLVSWIENLFPKSRQLSGSGANSLSFIVRIVIVVIAMVVIGFAIAAVVRRLPKRVKKQKKVREARVVLGERLEPEASATDLLAGAEALARSGDIRGAIRRAYIALLVELADRHVLSLAQNKTNRDYVRSVKNVPTLHTKMLTLTDSFERHWYGFIEATPDDWQNFRIGYAAALQSKN